MTRISIAALTLGALGLAGCASKTAAVHPAPYFNPTPTREAKNAVDVGDGNLEIERLRNAVTSRPDDVDARLKLAQAYSARGFNDVALEHLRLAAERFPSSLPAALSLARSLKRAGQTQEALTGLKAFIKAHPQTTAQPYEWLGILYDDVKDWKSSQLMYETALLYSPASAELHNNLGYSLLMQHLNSSAAMEFRAALRLSRNLAIARNNLGMALADKPQEAILNWQAGSDPATAHNNMAAVLMEKGDYAGARKELETALSYDRQNGPAIFNLALVAERDGKPATIPVQTGTTTKTAKQNSIWDRLFHPARASAPAKSAENSTAAAVQSAGSGN